MLKTSNNLFCREIAEWIITFDRRAKRERKNINYVNIQDDNNSAFKSMPYSDEQSQNREKKCAQQTFSSDIGKINKKQIKRARTSEEEETEVVGRVCVCSMNDIYYNFFFFLLSTRTHKIVWGSSLIDSFSRSENKKLNCSHFSNVWLHNATSSLLLFSSFLS